MSVTWTIHKGGSAYDFLGTLEDALLTQNILSDSATEVAIGGGGAKVVFEGGFVDSDLTDPGPESGTIDTIKVFDHGVLVAEASGYLLDLDDFEDPFNDLPDFSTFQAFFFDNPEQDPLFIMGSPGKDTLTAGTIETELYGKGGNDKLTGSDTADDLLSGGAGDDKLVGNGNSGGVGRDELFGGKGNDWLDGGAGIDEATGGKGKDQFFIALANGNSDIDIIFDFKPGTDKIVLSAAVFGSIGAKLGAGELIFNEFDDSPGNNYINYNPVTGALFYFAEGFIEGEVGLSFARLDNAAAISHTDFIIA